jgi:hypothetical protein
MAAARDEQPTKERHLDRSNRALKRKTRRSNKEPPRHHHESPTDKKDTVDE